MHETIDLLKVSAHIDFLDGIDFDQICMETKNLEKVFSEIPNGSYEKSTNGYPFYSLPNSAIFNNLREKIENKANEILPIAVEIYETWGVVIKNGQSIFYHTHYKNTQIIPEKYWSGVVFVNSPDGCADLVLHGYGFNRVESFIPITPAVGKIIFFNSFVPHFTTVNDTIEDRFTISFNLRPVEVDDLSFPNNHSVSPDNRIGENSE